LVVAVMKPFFRLFSSPRRSGAEIVCKLPESARF